MQDTPLSLPTHPFLLLRLRAGPREGASLTPINNTKLTSSLRSEGPEALKSTLIPFRNTLPLPRHFNIYGAGQRAAVPIPPSKVLSCDYSRSLSLLSRSLSPPPSKASKLGVCVRYKLEWGTCKRERRDRERERDRKKLKREGAKEGIEIVD